MRKSLFHLVLLLFLCGCAGTLSNNKKEQKMSRYPLTTLRIYSNEYNTPEKREKIYQMFDKYGKPDEVWLSTADGTQSMKLHKKVLASCVEFAKGLRKRNITVSLQLSSSIGHFGGAAYTAKDAFKWTNDDLLIGHDGQTSPGICCPSSPSFIQWCASIVAMYCKEIQPLTVYIDDDLRFHEHGKLVQTCCCKRCLDRFGKLTNRKWTRTQVKSMLDSTKPQPAKRQWIELHTQVMADFCEALGKAVNAVSPDTHLGLQTQQAKYFYSVWDFTPIYAAIKRATGRPARVRIGGGTWYDFEPTHIVRKAFVSACDIDDAKAHGLVDIMGNEEESWPCTIMNKSTYSKAIESVMFLAMGGNNVTFQSGSLWQDYDSTLEEFISMMTQWKPMFAKVRDLAAKYRFDGITALVQGGIRDLGPHGKFPWFIFWAQESEWLRLYSLPLRLSKVASQKGLQPGYLTGETARGISKEDFEKFLRAGVVATGDAYLELQKRGLTKDFKVKAKRFTKSHKAVFTGGSKPGTAVVWGFDPAVAFTFEKDCKAESLLDFAYPKQKLSGAWRLETPAGKIAVMGCPGSFSRKISHMTLDLYRDMFDWVGRQPVSARLENAAAVVLVPLADDNGKVRAVALVNTGTGLQKSLKLRIRRPYSAKAQWYQVDKDAVKVCGKMVDNKDECVFTLPELGSWQFALLELK